MHKEVAVIDIIKSIKTLNYSIKDIDEYCKKGEIDKVICKLMELEEWLKPYDKQSLKSLISPARKNLFKLNDKVLKRYSQYFEKKTYIGCQKAFENPDILIGLGARADTLEVRARYLQDLAKQHQQSLVVVSGGGFESNITESEEFYNFLEKIIRPERIIREFDSMDTIGNALFTKLKLVNLGILDVKKNILVVTSKFHCPRAYRLFCQIFGDSFNIACSGIKTATISNIKQLSDHELISWNQSKNEIFSLPALDLNSRKVLLKKGDHESAFWSLFANHEYYKYRYDLIRKYISYVSD